YLSSYARHVARSVRCSDPEYPDAKVKRVKVYRLIHQIIFPVQVKEQLNPLDPTFYLAYFQGEYDPDGKLVPSQQPVLVWSDAQRNINLARPNSQPGQDPYLYWLLPIYRVPRWKDVLPKSVADTKLIDCMSIHAGSDAWANEKK